MEKGLLARSEVVSLGTRNSKPHVSVSLLLANPRHISYHGRKGNSTDPSCLIARASNKEFDFSSNHLLLENHSSKSFRISTGCLNTSSRTGYILDSHEDEYKGVIVNSKTLPSDADDFSFMLHISLSFWKLKGKKGVWLKLPLDRAKLVPIAVETGFKFHHAEEEYVMLTYWIPEGPSMLPANASHQVGVGGFVINDKNEILVVQEKYCSSASSRVWKLPTGFINESEEIFDGVVREVAEETGVKTEFLEVIAFRHVHRMAFKKSDLFFICMLKPLSTNIKMDDTEIQAAKWMPLAEFIQQPFVQADEMFRKITEIFMARLGKRYCGLLAHRLVSKFDGRSSSLYFNVQETQDLNCPGA